MNTNANTAPHISDDMLVEILRRLPLLSIMRCKAVSKSWNDLICDRLILETLGSNITMTHLICRRIGHQLPPNISGYSTIGINKIVENIDSSMLITTVPLNMCFLESKLRRPINMLKILHSCNGLILCFIPPETFLVVNPLNKTSIQLPTPHDSILECISDCNYFRYENSRPKFALVFNPKVSNHFRVIFPILFKRYCSLKIFIFDSKVGEWNTIHKEVPIPYFDIEDNKFWYVDIECLVDGVFYITSYDKAIRVDINDECFQIPDQNLISLPPETTCAASHHFREWNGCLQLHEISCRLNVMRVWEFHDFAWKLKHTLSSDCFGSELLRSLEPCFHPDKNAFFMKTDDKTALMYYDLDTGKKSVIKLENFTWSRRFYPFSPSLVDLGDMKAFKHKEKLWS